MALEIWVVLQLKASSSQPLGERKRGKRREKRLEYDFCRLLYEG